jgi:hypothetical protein
MPLLGWLSTSLHAAKKPKNSIIDVLRAHLGGPRLPRSRAALHASSVTQTDFCPRKWALMDTLEVPDPPEHIATAMAVTFAMGLAAETLLVEEWAGDRTIGNWICRHCNEQRSWSRKPNGYCKDTTRKHWWKYQQIVIEALGMVGSPDALFDVGSPELVLTELKTLNPTEFDKIVVPLPEHRLRTNLYLKMLDASTNPYRSKVNLTEARVLYISRAYGRMNAEWNEILPFREFVIKRHDGDLKVALQKAKALDLSRKMMGTPSGICDTALDLPAKKCPVCIPCFSGKHPGVVKWPELSV